MPPLASSSRASPLHTLLHAAHHSYTPAFPFPLPRRSREEFQEIPFWRPVDHHGRRPRLACAKVSSSSVVPFGGYVLPLCSFALILSSCPAGQRRKDRFSPPPSHQLARPHRRRPLSDLLQPRPTHRRASALRGDAPRTKPPNFRGLCCMSCLAEVCLRHHRHRWPISGHRLPPLPLPNTSARDSRPRRPNLAPTARSRPTLLISGKYFIA